MSSNDLKRYAVVGTGGRAVMFIDALADTYRDVARLVGFCDLSQVRMDYYNRHIQEKFKHDPVPTFAADAFETMITQTRADTIIVCTTDAMHHEYIVRAMEAGCDVICEKPMTIDADKAKAITDAIDRTGKSLRVTFNMRYSPLTTRIRELVMQGVVGKPLAVDMTWMLDTRHGADYFRRWHREKARSGGLMVHKATHHFDMINWWIDARPQTVFAMGDLKFYGREAAASRGESYDYDRYTGHPEAKDDPFVLTLDADAGWHTAKGLTGLYHNAEAETGYIRDRNVFSDGVTIEDTMAVMVRYDSGVVLNYSLIAYCPWEGFRVAITGDKGRIEVLDAHGSHIIAGQSDEELAEAQAEGKEQSITVRPMFGKSYEVEVPEGVGAHGGGDVVLLEQLFSPTPPKDPFVRAASYLDGAASMVIGISANQSFITGQPVTCQDLIPLPPRG